MPKFSEEDLKKLKDDINEHYDSLSNSEDCDLINKQKSLCDTRSQSLKTSEHNKSDKFKKKAQQWYEINQCNHLRPFAATVQRGVTEILLAIMTLNSGLVSREKTTAEKVAEGVKDYTGEIPIPGLTTIITAIRDTINTYYNYKKGTRINKIANHIRTLGRIDDVAGYVARKLTCRYQEQIMDVSEQNEGEDLKKLGETARYMILTYLFSDQYDKKDKFRYQLTKALIHPPNDLINKLPESLQNLTSKAKVNTQSLGEVFAQELFTKPGIKTIELIPDYYIWPDELPEFGFRTGSENQAKALGLEYIGDKRPNIRGIPKQCFLTIDKSPKELDKKKSKNNFITKTKEKLAEHDERLSELENEVSDLRFFSKPGNSRSENDQRRCWHCALM